MDIYAFKLKFKSSTHFGDTGIDLENVNEWLHSDTFYSALINVMGMVYEKKQVDDLVKSFKEKPPFFISSLFVYKGNKYFLPRPMDDSHLFSELKKQKGKEIKKLKWLDTAGFKKWISDTTLNGNDIDMMAATQQIYKNAFKTEIRPRVSLDRVTKNSNIYHCAYIHFEDEAGLYGFVAFNDISTIDLFRTLLVLLGEAGIGGEKTYGCGMFEVVSVAKIFGELEGILFNDIKTYTLLSLYHPSRQEMEGIEDSLIAYDVVRKKGWITSGRDALPLKRQSIGFFTEGSVLRRQPVGCLAKVTPENIPPDMLDHQVYRYGFAFTAPIGRQ
jgi:CRISPR-associated protein Csm4